MKKRTFAIFTCWTMIFMITALLFGGLIPASESSSAGKITMQRRQRRISSRKAIKIARKATRGGTVTDCDLDYERGVLAYEVEIYKGRNEYTVFVRASSGKIMKSRSILPSQKKISVAQAKKIALRKAGGGVVTDWDLDNEFGIRVYEIEVRRGMYEYDITIKASNGKVLSCTREYDD